MSIRLRALTYTVGFVGSALILGIAVAQILAWIPPEYLPWIGLATFCGIGSWVVYGITKTQLEYQAKLQEMTNKK